MIQMYEDCFARVDFRCGVLKETLCKKGSCTFYTHRQEGRTGVVGTAYNSRRIIFITRKNINNTMYRTEGNERQIHCRKRSVGTGV